MYYFIITMKMGFFLIFIVQFMPSNSYVLPSSCSREQIYDPNSMLCTWCPGNASMVPDKYGFSCTCDGNSVDTGNSCRRCGNTELKAGDGSGCVPRRCMQDVNKRTVCRKCPNDYISLTQNVDGSVLNEVQCVKCSKGYKAEGDRCVHCPSCNCNKSEVVVRGSCLSKSYVMNRPSGSDKNVHPDLLLDIVKFEYQCVEGVNRSCRSLSGYCVRGFYSTDAGGPCRLWARGNSAPSPKGLPKLFIDTMDEDGRNPGEISPLNDTLQIVQAMHTSDGMFKFVDASNQNDCYLLKEIIIGKDLMQECQLSIKDIERDYGQATLAPYLLVEDKLVPIPVVLVKPGGVRIAGREWSLRKLRRYFIMDSTPSALTNLTNIVYLKTLNLLITVERDRNKRGKLSLRVRLEAEYATHTSLSQDVTVIVNVLNDLPNAGIFKGVELWGGILGALLSLYAIVQWRGAIKRGATALCGVPIAAGCTADVLYFSAFLATLHALAAEAGTLGLTLPMTSHEEYIIATFIYSALALKAVKVIWVNWKQCTCDIFFIDWSQYYPPIKEMAAAEKPDSWRVESVRRAWISLQTRRRVGIADVITLVLLTAHLTPSWQTHIPDGRAYRWCYYSIIWWAIVGVLYAVGWLMARLGRHEDDLSKVCSATQVSLLVFQEELYAHYVHGRNDDGMDSRALSGPLSSCRLVCVSQLRTVYKQLSFTGFGSLEASEARKTLLTRFLAAFFERALDGMSWSGSARTLVERLLDVEVCPREGGCQLLYDPAPAACRPPSAQALTWYGEEWSLLTFEGLLFSCVLITNGDELLASLATLLVWQGVKLLRTLFGTRNVRSKTELM